jgi:FtsH-binding integral membrane protein
MAFDPGNRWTAARGGAIPQADIDVGLRAHMLRVYNYMGGGLALTGLVAYATASSQELTHALFGTPLMWVIMLAPLGFVFALSAGVSRFSLGTTQALFWAYSAVNGLSLSVIFLVFTRHSITEVFFITAATFLATSLYGYTTRSNLAAMGSFLRMGVFGLIIAMVVNWFLGSGALDFAISVIGVGIFVGLTAWNTQSIKENYDESYGEVAVHKLAIMGALQLYLDFLNMFLFMLRLLGDRR